MRSGRFLYAVNELKTFEGRPTRNRQRVRRRCRDGQARVPQPAAHARHRSLPRRGRRRRSHVFVANFMSGSVCVLPVRDDGSLGEASDFVQHLGSGIDPARQKGPHAHAVTLDASERFAFVPDLGLDRLLTYRFDRAAGHARAARGAVDQDEARGGPAPPRLPSGRPLRVPRQRARFDGGRAGLRRGAGRSSTCRPSPRFPTASAVRAPAPTSRSSPSGAFVYTSNRGHDSIVVHRIDPLAGTLGYVGHAPTLGRTPRSFGIDPIGPVPARGQPGQRHGRDLPHRRRHRRAHAHRPRRCGADAGVREVPGGPARVIRVRRRGGPPGGHASALSRATR